MTSACGFCATPRPQEIGYQILAGGGLGRTPMEGKVLREFLPREKLLAYIEAILRVYNLEGRRDNKYKARIKILVHELGLEAFRALVEEEFAHIDSPQNDVDEEEFARIKSCFSAHAYDALSAVSRKLEEAQAQDEELARFVEHNLFRHKQKGYTALTISLKKIGQAPGDATSRQMRVIADLAEKYSFDELRVTHMQNIVLPHVRLDDVAEIFATLRAEELGEANVGLITDILSCPGLDYCALATARAIPVAQDLARHFADPQKQKEIGDINIKISGCINACGHHHVGNIGILGLEKKGAESYQITIGGDASQNYALGELLGAGTAGGSCAGSDRQGAGGLSRAAPIGREFYRSLSPPRPRAVQGRIQGDRRCCCLIVMAAREDVWERAENLCEAEGDHVLAPFAAILAAKAPIDAHLRLGAVLEPSRTIAEIAPFFDRLDLIVIVFPNATNGRGFSVARQIRQAGFKGRLRAFGPLIADQFPQALACGFDEVEIPGAHAARQPAQQWMDTLRRISVTYQRDFSVAENILDQRRRARTAGEAKNV